MTLFPLPLGYVDVQRRDMLKGKHLFDIVVSVGSLLVEDRKMFFTFSRRFTVPLMKLVVVEGFSKCK